MIARVSGTLVHREVDRVEIATTGGLSYELAIPLSVFETLPADGEPLTLHTHLAVREDAWLLYGFASTYERSVFQKLLLAKGFGPALALGILSALTADRVVRAIREKDVITLMRVPRVGRKKAEQLILDLADKVDGVAAAAVPARVGAAPVTPAGEDALRALLALGYPAADAERALKASPESASVAECVRGALAILTGK
jgi:Holliday junction DNA helicase RuvA